MRPLRCSLRVGLRARQRRLPAAARRRHACAGGFRHALAPQPQVQVIGDKVLVHTDSDAPRGRLCVASLTASTEWQTLIPQSEDTLQTVAGVAGRLYAVYSQAASDRVRIHAEDGSHLRDVELPALGSAGQWERGEGVISGVSGAWSGDEVWVRFESYVQPARRLPSVRLRRRSPDAIPRPRRRA